MLPGLFNKTPAVITTRSPVFTYLNPFETFTDSLSIISIFMAGFTFTGTTPQLIIEYFTEIKGSFSSSEESSNDGGSEIPAENEGE